MDDIEKTPLDMNILPPELWEIILGKVDDPLELKKLQRVCKHWYRTIARLITTSKKWKDVCFRKLPYDVYFTATMEKVYPMSNWHYSNNIINVDELDPHFWYKLVCSFSKWQLCLTIPEATDTVTNFPDFSIYEKITCTAIWDDNLAVGTNEGLIYFCKIYDLRNIYFKADHRTSVRQIKFWYNDGYLLAVSTCTDARLMFWDVLRKQKIHTIDYLGHNISTTTNLCTCEYQGVVTRYIFNAGRITRGHHGLLKFEQAERIVEFKSEDDFTFVISYEHGMIKIGSLYLTNENRRNPHDEYEVLQCKYNVELPEIFTSTIKRRLFVKWDIDIVAVSDSHLAYNSSDTWIVVNLFKHISGIVTANVVHLNLLILGLDSGVVYILDMSFDNLVSTNFANLRSKRIIVDNEAIVTINITETQGEQFIIATTERNVHVIRFF